MGLARHEFLDEEIRLSANFRSHRGRSRFHVRRLLREQTDDERSRRDSIA